MENQEINILGLLGRADWTEEEAAQLWQWLQHPPIGLQDHFQEDYLQNLTHTQPANPQQAREILARIAQQAGFVAEETPIIPFPETRGKSRPLFRFMAAAAVLVMAMVGGYFLFVGPSADDHQLIQSPQEGHTHDVNPGTYKAKLRLADGREIILDSAALGELAKQGNTSVINQEGQLVYSGNGGEVLYNTVSTGRGETYSMTLADGSQVWLNAGSSIYFPVSFPGKERRIEVTGEVYVKVARNPRQPFIASAKGLEVMALGTEFNINAYQDESGLKATLVEGSVKVNSSVILNPGEQAEWVKGKLGVPKIVNLDEVIGWKEGFFHFESADIKTILRQFARWYDIDVVYEGAVTQDRFFVIMNRNSSLATVLKSLKAAGLEFIIEGRRLTVKSGQ